MADTKGYARYQYSEFIKGGGRDGQIVIRSDDKAEFEEDKKYIDTIVAKQQGEQKKSVPETTNATHPTTDWLAEKEDVKMCPIHNKEMKAREGRFGTFYSHATGKDATGKWSYCNGKQK